MLKIRPIHCPQRSWMTLAIIIILSACTSTGLTRKQREAMEHHVHLTADAIVFSANKVKKSLSEFHRQQGNWPSKEQQQREIFRSVDHVLSQHNIDGQKLLEVDSNEIIVEYYFSKNHWLQFPVLLESWVIIFSNKESEELKVVAIYPNWSDPEALAKITPYSASQITKLRQIFREHLKEKLESEQLLLNDNLDEAV